MNVYFRSYLVVVRQQTFSNTIGTVQVECNMGNYCYIAARLDSNLINEDGYIFYIGDGKEYGGHVNKPLQPLAFYSAEIAVSFGANKVYYNCQFIFTHDACNA